MRIHLVGFDKDTPDFEAALADVPLQIGRHPDMDFRVRDRWASRYHCEIYQVDGDLWVRDIGSKHGVFVNGFHVPDSPLMPGDRLTVGTTSFCVDYERQTGSTESLARLETQDRGQESFPPVASSA